MASRRESQRSILRRRRNSPTITSIQCVWAEQIEPLYFSLNPVIFHTTILFFPLGYSNCPLSRECRRSHITLKKPVIQRILNTPMGQISCITGFLETNNKRIDRSIVSMLRSMFGGGGGNRTPVRKSIHTVFSGRRYLINIPVSAGRHRPAVQVTS